MRENMNMYQNNSEYGHFLRNVDTRGVYRPSQTTKNENFGFEPLTSFEKHPILDAWHGSEWVFEYGLKS